MKWFSSLMHQPRSQGLSSYHSLGQVGKMRDPGNEVAYAQHLNKITFRFSLRLSHVHIHHHVKLKKYKSLFAILLGWCGYFHDIHHWPTDCVRGHWSDLQ